MFSYYYNEWLPLNQSFAMRLTESNPTALLRDSEAIDSFGTQLLSKSMANSLITEHSLVLQISELSETGFNNDSDGARTQRSALKLTLHSYLINWDQNAMTVKHSRIESPLSRLMSTCPAVHYRWSLKANRFRYYFWYLNCTVIKCNI